MNNGLFHRFSALIREIPAAELVREIAQPQRLLLESRIVNGKKLEVAYAPFDHVNEMARIVVVGITPGRQQMAGALMEARCQLQAGKSERQAIKSAKIVASFSGPMRSNLVAMLDAVGVNRFLRISSSGSLWHADAQQMHCTSALRYPVFVDGRNFSGSPSMTATPLLRTQLLNWFAEEMARLPHALFVPLGPKAAEAVQDAARAAGVGADRVLSGLPHPSGANAERIAFFLGRKARERLSDRVEPERLVEARTSLEASLRPIA